MFSGKIRTSVTLAVLACTVGAGALSGQTPASGDAQQVLQPGDSVRVVVWRQPELGGGFIVSPERTLEHPLFQTVVVGGVPLDSARAHLAAALSKYVKDPEFVMEPFFRVVVIGQVRLPGAYAVPRNATLVEAVAAAGGPTENARLEGVVLVRADRAIPVDLTNLANPVAHSLILSGDQIIVPRNNDILRNYVGPIAAMVAAVAAIANAMLRH